MIHRCVGITMVLLIVFAAQLRAADTKAPPEGPQVNKGVTAKVVKVDATRKVLTVKTDAGKLLDVMIKSDTKFLGPRGGVSDEGLKDDRLIPGAEVSVVLGADGKAAKEIHLPFRKKAEKKDRAPRIPEKKGA